MVSQGPTHHLLGRIRLDLKDTFIMLSGRCKVELSTLLVEGYIGL